MSRARKTREPRASILGREPIGEERTVTSKALWVAGIFLASTSIALAHDTRVTWTESKAEKIVTRDATVLLPSLERTALESELRTAVVQYLTLEQTAAEEGYEQRASLLHNLRYRSSTALRKVRTGLRIDAVECTGAEAAVAGDRFTHFRCEVTSEVLEIPSAAVTWEEGRITAVVEGDPRIEGPFQARLDVHVTGRSTIAYRQIGRVALRRVSRP